MEEGATNEDLDLDNDNDNIIMDVACNEDDAIVYVTAGGIFPPRPSWLLLRDDDPPLLLLPL